MLFTFSPIDFEASNFQKLGTAIFIITEIMSNVDRFVLAMVIMVFAMRIPTGYYYLMQKLGMY